MHTPIGSTEHLDMRRQVPRLCPLAWITFKIWVVTTTFRQGQSCQSWLYWWPTSANAMKKWQREKRQSTIMTTVATTPHFKHFIFLRWHPNPNCHRFFFSWHCPYQHGLLRRTLNQVISNIANWMFWEADSHQKQVFNIMDLIQEVRWWST